MRSTQKPLSALWNVTRSTVPASTARSGWVEGWLGLADQRQEAGLGDQSPAAQPDHGELAPSHEFVGEGP